MPQSPATWRPEYNFIPKAYQIRDVLIDPGLAMTLREWLKAHNSALVFPSEFGGVDGHLLRLCKRVAKTYTAAARSCNPYAAFLKQRDPSDMVSQHELFGVRFQVDLPAEVGNLETANVVPDEREGDNKRHQAATIVFKQ